MHGPTLAATLAAAVWLGLAPDDAPRTLAPTPAESIARARALIAKDDARGAVALLQEALPDAGADLGPMIVVLRQAYTRAADAAAKAGRPEEAEEFRENLQILNRKMRGRPDDAKPAPRAAPSPATSPAPTAGRPHEVGFEPALPPASTSPRPAPPRVEPAPPPAPIAEAAGSPMPRLGPEPMPMPLPTPESPAAVEPPAPSPLPDAVPAPEPTIEPSPYRPRPEPAVPESVRAALAPEPAPRDPGVGRANISATQGTARGLSVSDTKPAPAPVGRPAAAPGSPDRPDPAGPSPSEVLKAADTAYLAGLYLDANAHYTALAAMGRLPEGRKIHWAYCRSVEVVRRLKAKPTSAEEWAAIDREIAEIKALSPKYWYAEYLRNRAADMSKGAAKPSATKGRVVRGAMPDSDAERPSGPSRIRDLTRPAPAVPPMPPVGRLGKPGAFAMAIPSTETPPVVTSNGESGRWKVKETDNFVVLHDDPALAERVAAAAESARESITRRWTGSPPPRSWAPKCEIYVYPNATIFANVTGQPADSPGFSTMESDGTAIIGRRVKLRGDAAKLVEAVVPHEVTHVILAGLFPAKQIPRWADEGIAVLSEPPAEQERRVGDLDPALDGGRIFAVDKLMIHDYPEGKYWALYYAQSVSLTRFLVEKGKPGQFIDFLQGSQRNGIEPELRRVYGLDGYADLQARWLAYARESSAARIAASRDRESRTR